MVVSLEIENNEEVGEDTYRPKDSMGQDPNVNAHVFIGKDEESENESEEVESSADSGGESEGVEPEEDMLAPLPEQRVAMHARAKNGDKEAMEEIETWAKLDEEGELVTYGGDHESSKVKYLDDKVYDLIEKEPSIDGATSAALALMPEGAFRQLRPEPNDVEEKSMEALALKEGWPTLAEYIPVKKWHPLRFVFDNCGQLVLPPGRAHSMYAFITEARGGVQQLELSSDKVKYFVKKVIKGRLIINFRAMAKDYAFRDPRLQKLSSQTASTQRAKELGDIKRWWRLRLRHARKRIGLADIKKQAEKLGILERHHPQNGVAEDFEWIDNIPATIDDEALARPAPQSGPPPTYEELAH